MRSVRIRKRGVCARSAGAPRSAHAADGWRFGDRMTPSLEGSNLLRTLRRSHDGLPNRPASAWVNDRRLALGSSVRF